MSEPETFSSRPYVGGQAVIEGVMMRSPGGVCVVVRRPEGALALKAWPLNQRLKAAFWRWVGFRGVAMLVESLSLGYRALHFSALQQEPKQQALEDARALDSPRTQARVDREGGLLMALSTLFAVGLFIVLPQVLAAGASHVFKLNLSVRSFSFHAFTGLFKLAVLLTYLFVIRQFKDVRRVFEYHGAEHKTIYAYEKGLELNVPNAREQSTLHPRCGTTFLVMVIILSIILGAVATPLIVPLSTGFAAQLSTLVVRLALLPLVAATAYELQRLSARYCVGGPLQFLLWPGYLVQKITTIEPDDEQLEVAVAAMRAALALDESKQEADAEVRIFGKVEDLLQDARPGSLRPAGA